MEQGSGYKEKKSGYNNNNKSNNQDGKQEQSPLPIIASIPVGLPVETGKEETENLIGLEKKYGKEPLISKEDLLNWH